MAGMITMSVFSKLEFTWKLLSHLPETWDNEAKRWQALIEAQIIQEGDNTRNGRCGGGGATTDRRLAMAVCS